MILTHLIHVNFSQPVIKLPHPLHHHAYPRGTPRRRPEQTFHVKGNPAADQVPCGPPPLYPSLVALPSALPIALPITPTTPKFCRAAHGRESVGRTTLYHLLILAAGRKVGSVGRGR